MPVLPPWIDYLPEPDMLRAVSEEALTKARKEVATLGGLPPDELAEPLARASAEAVRLMTLLAKPDAMGIVLEYVPSFYPALSALEQLANPFGVVAFANVVLAHGVTVEDWTDDRALAVLEAHARAARSSRELAYVAIGMSRTDLARALTGDRVVLGLADAYDAREWPAFYDFLEAFPEMDVGYAELFFVARAFAVGLEERDVRAAAPWIHRSVRGGPRRLDKHEPPPPPAPRVSLAMPKVQTGPSPFAWTTIEGSDIHGLWGGHAFAISSIGDIEVIDTMRNHRVRGTLDAAALADLDACIARHHPRSIVVARNAYAIPDETSAGITLVEKSGEISRVGKLASERSAAFDALWGRLMGIARSLLPK